MKILLVIPNAGYSGAEKQLLMLAVGLDNLGYDVSLCNLEGIGPFSETASKTRLKLKIINRNSHFDLIRLFRFGRFLLKGHFDVVISFTYVANNMTRILNALLPSLSFFHIAGERGRNITYNIQNRIDGFLSRFSNVIVCNSINQKEKLVKYEKIEPSKIEVIYNGFNISKLDKINHLNLYQEFSIPKLNRVICNIGNMSEHKNIPMFINVAEKVISDNDNISFLYIGTGPDFKKYQDEIYKRGLSQNIFLIGQRNDVLNILSSCDIFILTSSWEGMPNVLIEALFSKLPIICTAVDGAKEIISNNINGILIEPNDEDEMVRSVSILLEEDKFSEKLTNEGYNLAKSLFNSDIMVGKYKNIIEKR